MRFTVADNDDDDDDEDDDDDAVLDRPPVYADQVQPVDTEAEALL